MANITDHNPLVLDTNAVISATNAFNIKKIVLVAGAAAPATCTIKNGAGKIIANMAATTGAVDELDWAGDPMQITGFELASLAGAGAVVNVFCG